MSAPVPFTSNYSDHSTESGYQFEFFCMRCGNGYKSGFKPSASGIATKGLRTVSGMLGGRMGGLSYGADELKDMTESPAKDKALLVAVEEVSPLFQQCHKCGGWVCKEICWNEEAGLCVNCAPKLEQELAGMQAQRQLEQVQEKVSAADYAADISVTEKQVALCPHCGSEAASGKFCPECGKPLAVTVACSKCGTESPSGTKFCPECGQGLA